MFTRAGSRLALTLCGAAMLGLVLGASPAVAGPPEPAPRTLPEPARKGLQALQRHDLARANREFAAGLARDPRNAGLNGLNGLAYHLRVRGGERDLFDLAETGYLAALAARDDSLPLTLQLAELYFENGRYEEARRAAVLALDLEPDSLPALKMLAGSAYYAGDPELALWAVDKAAGRDAADGEVAAMRPLVYAAAGLDREARAALQASPLDAARRDRLGRRLDRWRGLYQEAQLVTSPAASATPSAPAAATPAAPVDFSAPPLVPGVPAAAPDPGAVSYAWWDCQQQLNQSAIAQASATYPSFSGFGGASADETAALPALPAPCRGRPLPRMAMIDAVLVRNDEVRTTGHGLNLLDGLSVYVSNSISVQRTWSGGGPASKTSTVTQAVGLGSSAAGGVAYSLNIANASSQRADILARPSLLALDRQSAQFFSGSTVSVALVSPQGGGNIEDRPVGVSLSVTPTFIDDDSMLVSVKAVRSFFEETAESATFEQSVQTSRNMVTANVLLRFDETLILSGLSEREISGTDSRTPGLGQVPGLQYLFARKDSRDFSRQVVILLTPRRVAGFADEQAAADAARAARAPTEPPAVAELRRRARQDLAAGRPNLTDTLLRLDRSRLFRALRAGDIELSDWQAGDPAERLASDLAGLVYY